MKTLYCDICGQALEDPIPNRTYFPVREYDLCEPCKDAIDVRLKPIVRGHFPYSPEWYETELVGLIEKAAASGRV